MANTQQPKPITMKSSNGRETIFMSMKNVPVWEDFRQNYQPSMVAEIAENGFIKLGVGQLLEKGAANPEGAEILAIDYYGDEILPNGGECKVEHFIFFPRQLSHFIIVDKDNDLDMVIYNDLYPADMLADLIKRGYLDNGQQIVDGGNIVY